MYCYAKTSKDKDGITDVVLKSTNVSTIKGLRALSVALICLSVALYSTATTYDSIIHLNFGLCIAPMLVSAVITVILSIEDLRRSIMHFSTFEKSLIESGGRFIRFNRLYIEDESKIVDSVHFRFQIKSDKVYIILKSYGDRFADAIREMENELIDLLGLELTDKVIGINQVIYVFRQKSVQPLDYAFTNWEETPMDNCIPLDSERSWEYDSLPHALVAGSTGSGKTFLLFHLICMALKQNAEIFICDPKKSDLYSLGVFHIPQIKSVESDFGPICRILRESIDKMNERYIQMQGHFGSSYHNFNYPPIFIVIDEIGSLIASIPKKSQDELNGYLKELIFKGRQAGIFIVLATQKPEAEAIPTAIRDQLGLRIALGTMSSEGYRMVFGSQDLTYNSCSPGIGYIYMHNQTMSIPQLFQSPRIVPEWSVIEEMKRSSRPGDRVPLAERADEGLLDNIK